MYLKSFILTVLPALIASQACMNMDDETFRFTLDNDEVQDCSWLTWRNDDKRIEKYCDRGDVKGACQESCESCPCADDSTYTFTLDYNGHVQTCKWFAQNNSEVRKEKYCYETDGKTVSTTGHHCIDACGLCSSRVPSSTPTGIPSMKPSVQPVAQPSSTPSLSPHPSANPTISPSSTPSLSPHPSANPTMSMEPSETKPTATGCMDDPEFNFEIDIGVTIDCGWLTKNNEATSKRKAEYCGRGHVKGACQYTCGSCTTCKDAKDYKFALAYSESSKSCAWLTRNWMNEDKRRQKYCYGKDGKSSSNIGDMCISACGFCKMNAM